MTDQDSQAGGDPFYRDLCSARTLATEQRGFFAQLAALVTDADADADTDAKMEAFAASPSDEARVEAVYAMPQVRAALANASPVFRGKDPVVSQQRRVAANRALADGALEAALALYSQAVVRAPAQSASMWTALGGEGDSDPGKLHLDRVVVAKTGSGVAGPTKLSGVKEEPLVVRDVSAQEGVECEGSGVGAEKGRRRRRRRKKGAEKPSATSPTSATPQATPTPAADDDPGERCLCEALAGRSAALAALGKHQLCVLDVRAALALGAPAEQRAVLCQRLATSCRALGFADLAMDCARVQGHADAQLVADRAARAAHVREPRLLPAITLAGGAHDQLHDASARLTLAETPALGRFVVAAEPLATGDTLLVQSPYAAVTFTEADASHCHHCLVRLEAAVACYRCSALAFCSERCRTLANDYHALECSYHDLLIGSGASALCRLALRMITQHPLSFFLGLRNKMADHAVADEPEPYLRVHALGTHAARRSVDDFLQRTIMALFLLRILQRARYFPEPSADDAATLHDDEKLIGALLLRHLQLLQFNAHEVAETTTSKSGLAARYRSVGVGIYPTASLFNHDCHPAVARLFVGSRMILRMLRPVAHGAAVTENYGPTFARLPLALRRRALLSRYWFRCECCACRNDWPTVDKLGGKLFRFRCPSAGCLGILVQPLPPPAAVRCASCARSVNLADAATALATALAGVDKALSDADAVELARCLDHLHVLGAPPSKEMLRAEDALRALFAVQ